MIYEIWIISLLYIVMIGMGALLGIAIGLSIVYYKLYIKSPESVKGEEK